MKFGTVINFCSNDFPFLRPCIDAIKPVSEQIIISVCDHFFDGKKEERETLDQIYAENADVQFIEFPFDEPGVHSSSYWHNLARMVGCFFLDKKIEYILFLDCDEIADGERFSKWQRTFPYAEYEAINLASYWYFRESHLQAKAWEDTPFLVKKDLLNGAILMNDRERRGIYASAQGQKMRKALSIDEKPLFHHYSWVRTQEQMIRKVMTWGHHWERDWKTLVDQEFAHPFNGTDFVHGYEFIKVAPFVSIDLLKRPNSNFTRCLSNVRKLSCEEVAKIDISLHFQIPVILDK